MEILDARGLSCPEPVIMLSKAMMSKENKYQINLLSVIYEDPHLQTPVTTGIN